jgi:hypothetical protein
MIQGRIFKYLQCQNCFHPKLLFENFTEVTLSLNDAPKSQIISLDDLLNDFFISKAGNEAS